jgi:hypothetical protein
LLAAAAGGVAVAALAFRAEPARAYPWMIHHGYTACAQCHVDPSGAGLLTDYGRAQAEILLRSHYDDEADQNPGKVKDFLFGAVPVPDPLHLQADVRGMLIPQPGNVRGILMQSDLRAGVQTKGFLASAALGVVSEGGQEAWVTSGDGFNLVSREYWVGVNPSKSFTVKAGRMNLPFGLRTEDHILDVRDATRTTINDPQQTATTFNARRGDNGDGPFLRTDQVSALQELGIFPALYPMHTFYWGDYHRESVAGPARAEHISPTGWLLAKNMMFTIQSDAPVTFPNSMRIFDSAVNRTTRSGYVLGAEHRITPLQALKAMTLWSAYQHFEEDTKGSLEVGKRADLVILDRNPLTVEPSTIKDITILETIKDGTSIYRRQ